MSKRDREAVDDLNESDLLLILAVLAHKNGIDAVAPGSEALAVLQSYARDVGQELSLDTIATHLKMAQIELLRRQVSGD